VIQAPQPVLDYVDNHRSRSGQKKLQSENQLDNNVIVSKNHILLTRRAWEAAHLLWQRNEFRLPRHLDAEAVARPLGFGAFDAVLAA
jgi:hypothetical protein